MNKCNKIAKTGKVPPTPEYELSKPSEKDVQQLDRLLQMVNIQKSVQSADSDSKDSSSDDDLYSKTESVQEFDENRIPN